MTVNENIIRVSVKIPRAQHSRLRMVSFKYKIRTSRLFEEAIRYTLKNKLLEQESGEDHPHIVEVSAIMFRLPIELQINYKMEAVKKQITLSHAYSLAIESFMNHLDNQAADPTYMVG